MQYNTLIIRVLRFCEKDMSTERSIGHCRILGAVGQT